MVLYVEYIHIVYCAAHHFAPASVIVQQHILALHLFGLLEAHFGGQRLHLLHQFSLHVGGVPPQYLLCLGYVLHVVLVALQAHAGCLAVLDVVFEAGLMLLLLYAVLRDDFVAAAQGVELTDEFEQGIHGGYVAVGAIIGAVTRVYDAGLEDAGEIFVRHHDAGVGFAILEQDVVSRVPLLDEVVLQQQGILFGIHHDIAYIAYFAHQNGGFTVLVLL